LRRHPADLLKLQAATGLLCVPIVLAARQWLLPEAGPMVQALARMPASGWVPVGYAMVASFAIAQVLWGRAIGAIGVAATAPFALLVPVFGVALAWGMLGERLGAPLLGSAILVLLGVALHAVPIARSAFRPSHSTSR